MSNFSWLDEFYGENPDILMADIEKELENDAKISLKENKKVKKEPIFKIEKDLNNKSIKKDTQDDYDEDRYLFEKKINLKPKLPRGQLKDYINTEDNLGSNLIKIDCKENKIKFKNFYSELSDERATDLLESRPYDLNLLTLNEALKKSNISWDSLLSVIVKHISKSPKLPSSYFDGKNKRKNLARAVFLKFEEYFREAMDIKSLETKIISAIKYIIRYYYTHTKCLNLFTEKKLEWKKMPSRKWDKKVIDKKGDLNFITKNDEEIKCKIGSKVNGYKCGLSFRTAKQLV